MVLGLGLGLALEVQVLGLAARGLDLGSPKALALYLLASLTSLYRVRNFCMKSSRPVVKTEHAELENGGGKE